jgi:phenylalanyl-tRNA synthetase beta subunit
VHLGERHDEGIVTWSGNTQDKILELIAAKTTDAVQTFLDPRYVEAAVQEIERAAGHPVTDPAEAVKTVSQRLRFTDAQQTDILAFTERSRRAFDVRGPVFA